MIDTRIDVTGATPRSHRFRFAHLWLALGAGLVVFAVIALVVGRAPSRALVSPEVAAGLDAPPGAAISFGSIFLEVQTPGDLRILDVAVTTAANTRMAGAILTLEGDNPEGLGWLMAEVGFPPEEARGRDRDARGLRVSEEELKSPDGKATRVQVTIGLEVMKGSIGGFNGVDVIYELAGIRHEEFFAHALLICVEPRSCEDIDTDEALAGLGLL